jgi:hypothetical protein
MNRHDALVDAITREAEHHAGGRNYVGQRDWLANALATAIGGVSAGYLRRSGMPSEQPEPEALGAEVDERMAHDLEGGR